MPALTAISRTFKALNFYFKIQTLSRTFKVRANPEFHSAAVCNATNNSPSVRESGKIVLMESGTWVWNQDYSSRNLVSH